MTPTNLAPGDDEGVEVLEAEKVYIIMKREYRISRNARAEWYLRRINSIITFPRRERLNEEGEELEVVSVIPFKVPPEWDSDTSHLYRYRVTHRTSLHFLARKYRLVFCLDLSPSTWSVDSVGERVRLDQAFHTLSHCLKGIVRPFYVPGSQLLFKPEIYLTIIGHTPFPRWPLQQVLVQGWLLAAHNLNHFLDAVHFKLTSLEAQLAQASAPSSKETDNGGIEGGGGSGGSEDDSSLRTTTVPPDIGFVDMLRYGIVALQLLPENSSAGIVVITDGVISLPDAASFESVLVQLRNQTVACSFLQLGSVYHPQGSLGYVPFTDLMAFLASATCGAYLSALPRLEGETYDYDMNEYHSSLLSWGFQTLPSDTISSSLLPPSCPDGWQSMLPAAPETAELIRKKEQEHQLSTSLSAVLSCRLREGYAIRQVSITDDQIQLVMVLPWKYSVYIEYHIRSTWPPAQPLVYVEVWMRATYEFLNDVTSVGLGSLRSQHRRAAVGRYWGALQRLRSTDLLLVGLQSFPASPTHFTVPECIRSGHPVFYHTPGRYHHHPPVLSDATSDQYPQFTSFWRPVCLLDTNVWQKWLHTHRLGVILAHDHPLPKNLHVTSASGRYGVIHCRQAELALTTLLADWCDFVLIENQSYVKFLYGEGEGEGGKDNSPVSFVLVRVTSKPPPCLVIRLAFLGGTPGHVRNQMVGHLRTKIKCLTFPSRVTMTERSKSLPPSSHAQDKLEGDMTISASGDLRSAVLRPPLSRATSSAPCCVITIKPVEKILIWYNKPPSNPLNPLISDSPYGSSGVGGYVGRGGAGGSSSKPGNHNMALLARYLYHRRWVWTIQAPSSPAVTLNAVARVLNCLTRIRLQEGFNFAYSCNGTITMAREFEMKLELTEYEEMGMLGHVDTSGGSSSITYPCVVQYIIFPPHLNSNKESSVEEDWEEEGDSVEADGEMQVVTECWVEPQNGVVVPPVSCHLQSPSVPDSYSTDAVPSTDHSQTQLLPRHLLPQDTLPESLPQDAAVPPPYTLPDAHFHHCNYKQIAQAFHPVDQQCIWGLMTVEHLLLMCQGEPVVYSRPDEVRGHSGEQGDSTFHNAASQDPSSRVLQIPFTFNLLQILPMCQQVELLMSTYIQDLFSSLVRRVTFNRDSRLDEANHTLYTLLLDHLSHLHQGREFPLSLSDHKELPNLLADRPRPEGVPASPFSNTTISKGGDPPKWRCFLRGISWNHLLLTLLPASYEDLKMLLVRRANISDPSNHALKMLPQSHPTSYSQQHQDADTEETISEGAHVGGFEGIGERTDVFSFGDGTKAEDRRELGLLKELNSDRFGNRGLGRLEHGVVFGSGSMTSPSFSSQDVPSPGRRLRYKSGPAPHSPFQTSPAPVVVRERASSFHLGRDWRGSYGHRPCKPSERNRAASVDLKDSSQNTLPSRERGRAGSVDWHTSTPHFGASKAPHTEHVRQRYVSMPSKSQNSALSSGVRSSSTEGLRNFDECVPLQTVDLLSRSRRVGVTESVNQLEAADILGPPPPAPPPPPSHTPMYGAVTLPIYVFDCKLSSITAQLINSVDRTNVVKKDIFLDSTLNLLPETNGDEGIKEDNISLDSGATPTSSQIQNNETLGSPRVIDAVGITPIITEDSTSTAVTDDPKQPSPEPRSEESDVGDQSSARGHAVLLEAGFLRGYVTGVFQALVAGLPIRPHDVQAALDHCQEAVTEIPITPFLQTICGHLRDFRLHSDLETLRHTQSDPTKLSPNLPKSAELATLSHHQPLASVTKQIPSHHFQVEKNAPESSDSSGREKEKLEDAGATLKESPNVTKKLHSKLEKSPNVIEEFESLDRVENSIPTDTLEKSNLLVTGTEIKSPSKVKESIPLIAADKEDLDSQIKGQEPKSPLKAEFMKSPSKREDSESPNKAVGSVHSTPTIHKFPLSLLKFHQPCRDLQQLHSSIRERFSAVLQGSFCPVPSLSDYYYFSPQSLHHSSEGTPVEDFICVPSRDLEQWEKTRLDPARQRKSRRVSMSKKSDVFTEGEEDLDDSTVNGEEEEIEEEEDDEDVDKSIEFRSELGSIAFRRLTSQLSEGGAHFSFHDDDGDMSTLGDTPIPPLFLHLTCSVRLNGHLHATCPIRTVPTCLGELVSSLSEQEVDLSCVSVTLDVLCMTLPPASTTSPAARPAPQGDGHPTAGLDLSRSARTTSFCSTASPQPCLGRSISESTCASLSDIDDSYLEEENQLGHLPNYQHQAVLSTVDEIKWLLRDEIASAMLHVYPLTEDTLEMVATHVQGSHHARNCISEAVPLSFVCGVEHSRQRFMEEFGRLSIAGHQLLQKGPLYYLARTTHQQSRRRHLSSLVPPLALLRPHPHADDTAQLMQMDVPGVYHVSSLSSPDPLLSPTATSRCHPGRVVSFETTELHPTENLGDTKMSQQHQQRSGIGEEKEKWVRRRERKERRDSERRGSVDTSDSDSDVTQNRSYPSRESTYPPYESRLRCSESPKKTHAGPPTPAKKLLERRQAQSGELPGKDGDVGGKVKEEEGEKKREAGGEAKESGREIRAKPKLIRSSGVIKQLGDMGLEDIIGAEASVGVLPEVTDKETDEEALGGVSATEVDQNINKEMTESMIEEKLAALCKERKKAEKDNQEVKVGGSKSGSGGVDALDGTALTDMQKLAKETSHRLSLPYNELVRCGSESLPRTTTPADVIRKSASIDSFVGTGGGDSAIDSATGDHGRGSATTTTTMSCGGGLWAEFIKSRHNSSEMSKSRNNSGGTDALKSRHNSGTGGELLKSRHNSGGTGSGYGGGYGGPYSDASSLLESGQTTEDGCEGDISDSEDDCCDWLQDYEPSKIIPPPFWLILRVSDDCVHTFFHCRTENEANEWRCVQGEVVRSVRALVKLVNQTLLLQDLHNTRMCNDLLEPEISDDIWRHEDTKGRGGNDSEPEYHSYLAASFQFKAGAFACRVVWETKFELHPKVKLCAGKVGSKAIQALRTILNPFSVNNRKNMFVYEDSSGNGSHVFYIRLKEVQSSGPAEGRGRGDEAGLAHSSSVVSLSKRDETQQPKAELRPRVSSFGEKDVIMEGVPSAPAHRRRSHHILLTVHGIADPGPAIKEELVRMLQNRLDEAVVEAICLMLWSNPQHKLTPEDVHFIQPPYHPPKTVLRFTLNACALPHLQAVGYYLRQNMLSCGFIHPKYADSCPEHHFQDFSATDQDLSNEPNIFLFVRPRKSAAKGIACIAFSLVDGSGCIVQHLSCARPSPLAYQEIFSSQDFESMTHTQEYHPSPSKSPGPMALLQFKVWESGRVDLPEVRRHLLDSARHALWDLTTEYRLLTAPILPTLIPQPLQTSPMPTPASEPTTPKKETRGHAVRSVSLLETCAPQPLPAEDRTRSVSVSGVPPHVSLPRSRFGSKRLVRGSVSSSGGGGENRGGDGQQRERAPSPLTLVQARLRLMSSSVPDLKYRSRRASLHSAWDSPIMDESGGGVHGVVGSSHSPLKVRHSVDLGVERSKLLMQDESQPGQKQQQQPWEQMCGTPSPHAQLHPLYTSTMVSWLDWAGVLDERGDHLSCRELGEKGGEHAVKRHTVYINSRHAVPIFLSELQKWMNQHYTDTNTHIFVQDSSVRSDIPGYLDSPAYTLIEPIKLSQVVERDLMGGYIDKNFVVVGRNNQQWWATLYEENYNDYYLNAVTSSSSKNSQRYQPLVVSPRGRCVSGGADTNYTRSDSTYSCNDPNISQHDTSRSEPSHIRPGTAATPVTPSLGPAVTTSVPTNIPMSPPVTVPSTPTSLVTGSKVGTGLWGQETSEVVFVPRQKLFLATLNGLELRFYTYNWTKEQCDSLHTCMTKLAQWSTARTRLMATVVLQKMGLYHNQPFTRKAAKKEEENNTYLGNHSFTEGLVKNVAPPKDPPITADRPTRRQKSAGQPVVNLTDIRESWLPVRSPRLLQFGRHRDLVFRQGAQMATVRGQFLQKENQRQLLLKTVVETRGNLSPAFTNNILALYKQHARLVHFCYTPLLFLPRWRWQVAAGRDHSLGINLNTVSSPTEKIIPTKVVPEPRSRHSSGSSMKGVVSGSGVTNLSHGVSGTDLRRSLSLRSASVSSSAAPSPGQQRRRNVTGGGDEKWHKALCSGYLKEYIQYLQSLGFLPLNVTQGVQYRGQTVGSQESESSGFRGKEVRFSEQATKQPTYLLKNVLGGTILLEIAFYEPYFSAKAYILESCRLEGKRLSTQMEEGVEVRVVVGPPPRARRSPVSPHFPEGRPPDQIDDKFAISSFLDKVDDIKVLLHMHSFTYDFHLRSVCEYVADRQLLFAPGYHLSSCLSDFIKYYNKGPNFARNLIYSGALTIEDTGTPGEQLYNYLLAREKHYRMRVLRMTPLMIDPDAEMHYTEFILVHTKTCRVRYRDANDQCVSDEYDVTLLVSHNTSPDITTATCHDPRPNILHLNFYVILTSKREMYPNRILEKKMGKFRTVSVSFAPTLSKRWTPSSTRTESRDHSGSGTPPAETTTTTTNNTITEAATDVGQVAVPTEGDVAPHTSKSYTGISSESVNYLGYYTLYEETMQNTLQEQAEEARKRIHDIFNQAKIHCRRDSLWHRLTASIREDDRQKLSREQVVSCLSFCEISELLELVSVEPLSSVDPQLLPLLSKPLHWYQALTRVLQNKYQDRHRSLTSSDGNIQHVTVLSPSCPDAFMMLSINLHHQKAELCCVSKQLKGEGSSQVFSDRRIQTLVEDFVNACCFHLWCELL